MKKLLTFIQALKGDISAALTTADKLEILSVSKTLFDELNLPSYVKTLGDLLIGEIEANIQK